MKKILFLLALYAPLMAGPIHDRTGENLPIEEKEFAQTLSLKYRRIFCGRFNEEQRRAAIAYSLAEIPPDIAVLHVMEETGIALPLKRPE